MSKVIQDSLVNQTIYPPMDSLNKAREFVQLVQQYFSYESIGLLTDDDYKNQLFLFLEHEEIIVAARFNLASLDMQCLLDTIKPSLITYRHLQGQNISCNNLDSIESIKSLWAVCDEQSRNLESKGFIELLARIEKGELSTGRGANFSTSTKNKVYMDSHGRCMFSGCGERLGLDELTGIEGNYSYLAHNVASAENGPRGILFLSAELSDEPSNILLLCDKHHRLIDKIATCDYPAVKLTNMRKEFIALVSSLLDGLSYQPIPVYVVLWPVNSNVVSVPELREISSSLSSLKLRCSGSTRFIHDSNDIFLKKSDLFIKNMPEIISDAANKVISQTKNDRQKAALFAFGPMPALIGLGASLGNKGGYIPMLMYRDGACWMWPSNNPINEFYEILGLELLQKGCNDVVICINFTAVVPKLMAKAEEISQKYNANIITINAKPEFIGNGAIGHPQDGITFSVELQKLLHKIKSDFGIQQVHLLVCASNAASVFIGLSYDLHHPQLIVYDFVEDGMEARLVINNDSSNGTTLVTIPNV